MLGTNGYTGGCPSESLRRKDSRKGEGKGCCGDKLRNRTPLSGPLGTFAVKEGGIQGPWGREGNPGVVFRLIGVGRCAQAGS